MDISQQIEQINMNKKQPKTKSPKKPVKSTPKKKPVKPVKPVKPIKKKTTPKPKPTPKPQPLPKKQVNRRPTKAQSNQVPPVKPTSTIKNRRPVKKPLKPQPATAPQLLDTSNNQSPSNSNQSLSNSNQPNLSQPQSNMNDMNDTQANLPNTFDKSSSKYKALQKQSNNDKIDNSNNDLFQEIITNQKDMNVKPIDINKYSKIVNQIKTLFNKTDILIQNGALPTLLIKQFPLIMKTLKDNYKVNTQRAIITNIITLLTYSNNDIKVKDLKAYELYRKNIQLQEKQMKQKQSK